MPVLPPLQAQPPVTPSPSPAQLPSPFSDVAARSVKAFALPPVPKAGPASPLAQFAIQNLHHIISAGVDVYQAKNHDSVFFNPTLVTHDELKKADEKGDLPKIAPTLKSPPLAGATVSKRTVHTAPNEPEMGQGMAKSGSGARALPLSMPQGSAQANPAPLAAATASQHVPQSKRAQSARVTALEKANAPSDQDPTSVVDKLSTRPI